HAAADLAARIAADQSLWHAGPDPVRGVRLVDDDCLHPEPALEAGPVAVLGHPDVPGRIVHDRRGLAARRGRAVALVRCRPRRDGVPDHRELLHRLHRVLLAGEEHHAGAGRHLQLRESGHRRGARLVVPAREVRRQPAARHGGDVRRRRAGELAAEGCQAARRGPAEGSVDRGLRLGGAYCLLWRMTSTRPRDPMNQEPTQLTTLTIKAPPTADQKPPGMVKPGNINATSPSMAAFTTSRNRPSESNNAGSDSSSANGRTMAFTMPSSS